MKRLATLASAAILVLACALALCACSGTSGKDQKEATYTSGTVASVNGTLYYAGFGYVPSTKAEIEGATKIPVETSDFLIYQDKVYYAGVPAGTGGDSPVDLHCCKLDGSEDTVLSKDLAPQSRFYVVDGCLVYEHYDENMADPDNSWDKNSDYWVKLDLGTKGASPVPLSEKKDVQVIAASSSKLYYVKAEPTDFGARNAYCASLDLSDEVKVYKGGVSSHMCSVDHEGRLLIADDRGRYVTTYDADLNKLAVFKTGYDSVADTMTSLQVDQFGVFVTNPEDEVTRFDVTTGETTSYKVEKGSPYYLDVQYADDTQIIYISAIVSDDDSDPSADNTVLYRQNWDRSNFKTCGTWFES